jgi:hypothetical protein
MHKYVANSNGRSLFPMAEANDFIKVTFFGNEAIRSFFVPFFAVGA